MPRFKAGDWVYVEHVGSAVFRSFNRRGGISILGGRIMAEVRLESTGRVVSVPAESLLSWNEWHSLQQHDNESSPASSYPGAQSGDDDDGDDSDDDSTVTWHFDPVARACPRCGDTASLKYNPSLGFLCTNCGLWM